MSQEKEANNYIEETRNRYRSESAASSYQEGYNKGFSIRKLINKIVAFFEKKAILKALQYTNSKNIILDIPCGTGKLVKLLSNQSKQYVGADVSFEMIQEINAEKQLQLIQADGVSLPFKDNAFEIVVSLRLFHRLPAEIKKRMLLEFVRITQNDIIFSFSNDNWFYKKLISIKSFVGIIPEKVILESIKLFIELLNKNGFHLIKDIPILTGISNQSIYLFAKKRKEFE